MNLADSKTELGRKRRKVKGHFYSPVDVCLRVCRVHFLLVVNKRNYVFYFMLETFATPAVKSHDFSASFPGFRVQNVPYDGQCAFSSISHQLSLKRYVTGDVSGDDVRRAVVHFLATNEDLKLRISKRLTEQTIDDYITGMALTKTWADENILYAASLFYDVEIHILRDDDSPPTHIVSSTTHRSILLGYVRCADGLSPMHYVSLVPNTGMLFICTWCFIGDGPP